MEEEQDIRLVRQCLNGYTGAFEQIVHKYQKLIFNLVYHMTHNFDDAEELTQAIFVKVFENLDHYNSSYKFYSWIYRIAVNESLNFIKRNKHSIEIQDKYESRERTPDKMLIESEISEEIGCALDRLEPNYRMVIILRHFLDYSYKDISDVLQLPEKKVKSRLYSARQILANILTERGIIIND